MAAIIGILTSLVGLGQFIVVPIKRQINYYCCFSSNIKSLRDEAKNLDDARKRVAMQVEAAVSNSELIFPEVDSWLMNADDIQGSINEIEREIHEVQGSFLSMKSRFSLSKKAKKTTEFMKLLQDGCKFPSISQRPLPAAMLPGPFVQTYEFESRKNVEEDILSLLRDKKVNMIGICGMGGVGKTTMVERIIDKVKEKGIFDEVVKVIVSQQVDRLKIQHEIAESLDLKLDMSSLSVRAHHLHSRLVGKKRSTLIVLDDVWEKLKLEDLGIPCRGCLKECIVILASRDRGVLDAMDVHEFRTIQILSENEAWFLFREKAGSCVDDLNLFPIAQEVAKECKGLPIALVTVGTALKDKPIFVWEDALKQLKESNPSDMLEVINEVYNPIKLSYDFLENERARSLFLLCCLFAEDFNIRLEYLAWYITGLRVLGGIMNLKEARNRVCTLVEMLKSRFLLLEGRSEYYVKMHDVVRDVAIFIASKEKRANLNFSSGDWSPDHPYIGCTWMSVIAKERIDLPIGLSFPNLRLLLIHSSEVIELEKDGLSFEGMKELNVLYLKSLRFRALPQTIESLKNLRTLHLDSCTLKTIAVVGKLSSLEILSCRSCHEINEIPAELGGLTKLRFLEFSDCIRLQNIAPGIISNMVQLEELRMIGSFNKWESGEEGKETRNISLSELKFLLNLTCLEIEIYDCTLAADKISLSSKIAKYDIRIYGRWPSDINTHDKKMFLELTREITLGGWILKFLSSAEFLDLTGDGSNSLDLSQVQNVKSLGLSDCSTVKQLVDTRAIDWRYVTVFPVLESLWLCRLSQLEKICVGSIPTGSRSFGYLKELTLNKLPALMHLWKSPEQNVSLSNLRFIHVWGCTNLRNLFSSTMARGLLRLELLEIRVCDMMEEVFCNENVKDRKVHLTFPKLKRLSLDFLPRLMNFCKGIESIEFPSLAHMDIGNCPRLVSFASTGNNLNWEGHDHDSLHLFCNQKVTFGSLKELNIRKHGTISNIWCRQIPLCFFNELEQVVIESCDNIRSLFSSSIAQTLVNLKELKIEKCRGMVNVIGDEENVCEKSTLFPSLELLILRDLPKLGSFCQWSGALELPSLKQVLIDD